MMEHAVSMGLRSTGIMESSSSKLQIEYRVYQDLLDAQPALTQQYLRTQANILADAIIQNVQAVKFNLPDQVVTQGIRGETVTLPVRVENREQELGGLIGRFMQGDIRVAIRSRLWELEHSPHVEVFTSGVLLRHALAIQLVHDHLPSGKTVVYKALDGDEIPSIPVHQDMHHGFESTTAESSSASADDNDISNEKMQAPYDKAARWFYMPQWVCFDDGGHLLVGNINEAEAYIASMQHYLGILTTASEVAPYIVADEDYQRKRYGIRGQLVNQGRALVNYEIDEIIQVIKKRAAAEELNRGLSLSLPYFNDQTLSMEMLDFDVIPNGRVLFVHAFVVLAIRAQATKVAQDTHLNLSTRMHLLGVLSAVEQAFLR